jgi:hypothetical protein
LYNLIKLIKIAKLDIFDKKIYVPHMICFRGRFYALSDVSYTFNKEFRFCSYSGYYNKDINKNEKFYNYNDNNLNYRNDTNKLQKVIKDEILK